MLNEEYHAHPAISRSKLQALDKSPWHYYMEHVNPSRPEKKRTDSMEKGTAIHMALLEPILFEQNYMCRPEGMDLRKSTWKDFAEKHANKIFLSKNDYDSVLSARDAVLAHPIASILLDGAECERAFFWTDPDTGIECKCKPDILNRKLNLIGDIKKSRSNQQHDFEKQAAALSYFREASWYIDGLKHAEQLQIEGFIFITVEDEYPYHVELFTYEDEDLQFARDETVSLLRVLKDCIQTQNWPKFNQEIKKISIPTWRKLKSWPL